MRPSIRRCLQQAQAAAIEPMKRVKHRTPQGSHVLKIAGSRLMYLGETSSDTPVISAEMLTTFMERMKLYSTLPDVVDTIGFSSKSPTFFSRGMQAEQSTDEKIRVLEKMIDFSDAVKGFPKNTIVSYEGEVADAAIGAFQDCQFTVATSKTLLRVAALQQRGELPIGGIAWSLTKGSPIAHDFHRVPLARYLGLSGWQLTGEELFERGLVSHLLGPLQLAHSVLSSMTRTACDDTDMTKQVQPTAVEAKALSRFLTLNSLRYMGRDKLDSAMPGPDEAIWKKALIVPPSEVIEEQVWLKQLSEEESRKESMLALFEGANDLLLPSLAASTMTANSAKKALQSLLKSQQQLESEEENKQQRGWISAEESRELFRTKNIRLRTIAAAKQCLSTLESASPAVVEAWFQLVEHGQKSNSTLTSSLKLEIQLLQKLDASASKKK